MTHCPFCNRLLVKVKSYSIYFYCEDCPVVHSFNYDEEQSDNFSVFVSKTNVLTTIPNVSFKETEENFQSHEAGTILNDEKGLLILVWDSDLELHYPQVERTKENILKAYSDFLKLIKLQALS
jgi:uncharacterized Zn finger protein